MAQQTFTVDLGLTIIDNSPGGGSVTGGNGAVNITADDLANTATSTFDPTGKLTVPGEVYGQFFTLRGGNDPGAEIGSLGYAGNIVTAFGTEGFNVNTGAPESGPLWQFSTTGNLTLPGNLGANNASITSINAGEIVGLNSQANGIVGIKAYGSAANLVAGVAVNGGDSETDRVTVSVFNPAIDDNEYWSFNTAGDFTTGTGNIFFGTDLGDPVIVPGSTSIKIAADRSDVTSNYISIGSSGIVIDALGGSSADIRIRASDDVFIAGGDKTANPGQSGGVVNIDGGQGGPDSGVSAGDGGDVNIQGGRGGDILAGGAGDGGEVFVGGGSGSTANVVNSLSAGAGGPVTIYGGEGGQNDNNSALSNRGGNVDIYGGQGSFDFGNSIPNGDPGHVNIYGGNWGYVAPSGNIYFNSYDGTNIKTLTYDNAGNVTMAAGGSLNFVGTSSGIVQSPNNNLVIRVQDDENAAWSLYNRVTDAGNVLAETRLKRDSFSVAFPNGAGNLTFDNTGVLTLPGEGVIRSNNDTVTIESYDTANAIGLGFYVGTNGGLFFKQGANPNWLTINPNASNAEISSRSDLTLTSGIGTSGAAGNNISITAGAADQSDYYTTAGGNVNITGGLGAFNDGGGGGPGGSVNISAGNSSDPAGVPGNVTVNSGSSTWTFDYNNRLSSGNLNITSQYGLGVTGTILENGGTLELIGNGTGSGTTGCVVVGWNSSYGTAGNVAQIYLNPADSTGNIVVTTGNTAATNYQWNFDKTGNLTAPGAISATGNITVGNVNTGGRISATGNLLGGNLTVTGNAVVTYTPATATGYGITVNAANTQGGTGYADFLKATNTSGGATNPNKSFRLSSTGAVEIINSAYSATILSLSDTGGLSVPGPISVSGKQAVNGPAFSAYAAATLQNIPNGTQTKVLFQTEEFDTNSNYASSRFTPTVEGYYQLNAEVRLDGASGTGEMMIILYKNGSEYKRGTNQSGTQIAANFWAMQVSSLAYANGTGDYFEIYVQQGSGGTISVTAVNAPAITWFNGCMIRGA